MSHGEVINKRVKAISGHFEGKTGTAVRKAGNDYCVCWDGGWEHGIWESGLNLIDTTIPDLDSDDDED